MKGGVGGDDARREKNVARIMAALDNTTINDTAKLVIDKGTMKQAQYLANLYGTSDKVIATVRAQAGLSLVADAMAEIAKSAPVKSAIVDIGRRGLIK